MKNVNVLTIFVGLALSSALCQVAHANCNEPRSQAEMNQCEWNKFKRVERTLIQTYKKIQSDLQKAGGISLVQEFQSQEFKWISQLQTECALERMDSYPGSMAALEQADCYIDHTNKRIAELHKKY